MFCLTFVCISSVQFIDIHITEIIRHLVSCVVFTFSGPMKHTAFAKFDSVELAEKCLQRLHQLEVLGRKLVVEFAKTNEDKDFPVSSDTDKSNPQQIQQNSTVKEKKDSTETQTQDNKSGDTSFQKHGIPYPRKPNLYYLYPPPTVSALTNIANALASDPRFYTQVLHLMNKMNLPCPFGTVTASPPLAMESRGKHQTANLNEQSEVISGDIDEIRMDQDSTEESEIESDTEHKIWKGEQIEGTKVVKKGVKRPRKKMRLIQPDMSTFIKPTMITTPKEVFENAESLKAKQITLNIPATTPIATGTSEVTIATSDDAEYTDSKLNIPENSKPEVTVVEGGFGKVEPQSKPKLSEEVQKLDANYTIDPKQFLDKDNVASGRLNKSQFRDFSVFKKYSSGECTSRLYIKNLTKHTTEQELVNLFGAFIDWSAHLAYEAFDIRLMKEGRMKGQAFVTLPDEAGAQAIVDECNGYILNNKPIVIQFARSAKAKEVDKPVA